ncbi:MAG: beta-ketoacyl-[acyl-carrier-protein] synthase family protein [Bacteroidia bacterium]|nr:beta-ketoacyl-[acyl-carrier-protein] synthase family protein [Bacteroidia bacterium]
MSRILVSGIGLISSIGTSKEENHLSLKSGICGMRKPEFLETIHASRLVFGEVKLSTPQLKELLKASEKGITRTTLLALKAFEEALLDSKINPEQHSDRSTAFINASTVGGMSQTDEMYHDANSQSGGSEFIGTYDFASSAVYIQERYKLQGLVNTINTACSSSANAIMYGARLIKQGKAKRAIVGGTDSLSKFTVNGFNSLGILSPEFCKPFDETRKGLNLGEGAAYLVLEKEEDCAGKTIYAEVSGYCNSNDSFHASSLSETGEGPYLAMKGALETAGLKAADIDFINAHGTATENNDLVESRAMMRIFDKVPPFLSTKANTGHTLGAAGAIEAVYSILSLYHNELYPALNFNTPINETKLIPVKRYEQKNIRHVLSNSFGFGGNCTSLVFSKA